MPDRTQLRPAPIFSLAFARSYWITMRPYLLFVSGITGIAGLSFAPDLPPAMTILLSALFFLTYGFGQALTDCFQTDTDSLSSPYRPLVQGRLQRRDVLTVSLVGLAVCGTVISICNPLNALFSIISVLGLATYTFFKRRWWAGPFYNAWIVALLCLMAYAAAAGRAGETLALGADLMWTLLAVFFAYANFVLVGYFKDISADRTTGYRTLPVIFGWQAAAWISDLFALCALIACGLSLTGIRTVQPAQALNAPALSFAVAGLSASFLAQFRLHRISREEDAHRAIAPVVHAYILLLSSLALSRKPSWAAALVVYYIAFIITLKARPEKAQI